MLGVVISDVMILWYIWDPIGVPNIDTEYTLGLMAYFWLEKRQTSEVIIIGLSEKRKAIFIDQILPQKGDCIAIFIIYHFGYTESPEPISNPIGVYLTFHLCRRIKSTPRNYERYNQTKYMFTLYNHGELPIMLRRKTLRHKI